MILVSTKYKSAVCLHFLKKSPVWSHFKNMIPIVITLYIFKIWQLFLYIFQVVMKNFQKYRKFQKIKIELNLPWLKRHLWFLISLRVSLVDKWIMFLGTWPLPCLHMGTFCSCLFTFLIINLKDTEIQRCKSLYILKVQKSKKRHWKSYIFFENKFAVCLQFLDFVSLTWDTCLFKGAKTVVENVDPANLWIVVHVSNVSKWKNSKAEWPDVAIFSQILAIFGIKWR